jgi:hypothetical protein
MENLREGSEAFSLFARALGADRAPVEFLWFLLHAF